MSKKLVFDTLEYVKILQNGKVDYAETHCEALANAIVQNLYTKNEVDQMFAEALKRSDEKLEEMKRKGHEELEEMKRKGREGLEEMKKEAREMARRFNVEMNKIEKDIEKIGTRTIVTTISILGSLIVLVGAISTFSHYFFH